ncbi:MAG: hypothetical protein CVV53_00400 [Spirochaetae bacterium HGW-Spirochaetae-9]|nr:MAG: hypothetical protein CVV53_00400 [Spirochaetae bacterium HGW-Spirochaetae-9]
MDHNKRPIQDREAAFENLIIMRDTLARHGIKMFLSFGTLLGAVRGKDFIPYDDDVDIGIFDTDSEGFVEAVSELSSQGLFLTQCWENKRFYAFERKGEFVDVFTAMKKRRFLHDRWDLDTRASVPARHLDTLEAIDFKGEHFFIPFEAPLLLRNLYGKNWRIPIQGCPSRFDVNAYIERLIANPEKLLYFLSRFKHSIASRAASRGKE